MSVQSWLKRAENLFSKRALALCYHRIDETAVDPWELAVSPKNFAEQLQVLQAYRVLPTTQVIRNQRDQVLPTKSICLTFDDGYVDNATLAKPLLERYETPACFFIATGYTDRQELFWWDELAMILLQTESLPRTLQLSIGNENQTYSLEESHKLDQEQKQHHRRWVYTEAPPTERCRIYLQLWDQLRAMEEGAIRAAMKQIRQWARFDPHLEEKSFPMKKAQVQDFTTHPLFELGMHTVSHCNLSVQPAEKQRHEIGLCKTSLEKDYGISATMLSYPYGKYNKDTIGILAELKLAGGFTTCGEAITHQSNPYQLGRLVVKNWNGEMFEKQLRFWFHYS
ncbi:MAG TPA: polysaccharide deacetylase family protein [Flavisolibacter sp.]|jgi:peptidoglycan/xylan/chitin deacetylase (PgdA/CDA1 family)|nr:polysaccharide deacetylase family protein [Flavisolibacter sp.]